MSVQRPILYIALGALLSLLLMAVILLTVTLANADAGMRIVTSSDIAVDAPGLVAAAPEAASTQPPTTLLSTPHTRSGLTPQNHSPSSEDQTLDPTGNDPDEDDGARIIREHDDSRREALRRIYATAQATPALRVVSEPLPPPPPSIDGRAAFVSPTTIPTAAAGNGAIAEATPNASFTPLAASPTTPPPTREPPAPPTREPVKAPPTRAPEEPHPTAEVHEAPRTPEPHPTREPEEAHPTAETHEAPRTPEPHPTREVHEQPPAPAPPSAPQPPALQPTRPPPPSNGDDNGDDNSDDHDRG